MGGYSEVTPHNQRFTGTASEAFTSTNNEFTARIRPSIRLHQMNMRRLFWLPVIGPSALWTHRRLTAGFRNGQSSYRLDIATLGREIGLGAGTGRHSPVIRTLTRLVHYHLAEVIDGRLGVQTMLPPLTRHQAARLPEHLAARHREQAPLTDPRRSSATPTRTAIRPELDL